RRPHRRAQHAPPRPHGSPFQGGGRAALRHRSSSGEGYGGPRRQAGRGPEADRPLRAARQCADQGSRHEGRQRAAEPGARLRRRLLRRGAPQPGGRRGTARLRREAPAEMGRGVMAFSTILVANRGEIAWRVMRTAKAMGYRTVAVYSDADKDAPHVAFADQAARIGPAPVAESYLSIDRILEAAHTSGADAVHPGYGFLSENAEFAAACEKAGLVFIGPPPSAIAAMGNKAAAKRRMIEAGVPCVPGYQGADQDDAHLEKEARKIGLPVMVKAAAGGGGRGMRLVERDGDLLEAIRTARTEAESAFGSGELILEKAVVDARHVEIQVF